MSFKSIGFYKNLNFNLFNSSFKTLFFFLKILEFKNKTKLNFNNYVYDLNFKFPKLSLKTTAIGINFFFSDKKRGGEYNFKHSNLNNIFFKTPPTATIGDYFSIILKRAVYLIVGSFSDLPLNYTISGYFIPFIIRAKKKLFFHSLGYFFLTLKYNFFEKKIEQSYADYKYLFVFNSQVSDINMNVLFFLVSQKKINFLKYSNYIKEYNIFISKKLNATDKSDFFKLNWLLQKTGEVNINKKIKNINIQIKHKYLLKFHRKSFNTLFSFKYRSNKLSKIFKKIPKKKLSFFLKHCLLELSLIFLVIRSKFAFNLEDSRWLINNGFVFINGIPCYNFYFVLKKNDRIQILLEKNEYINFREIISRSITRRCRMFYTLNKYYLTLNQPYKTQPTSTRKWIIKSLWMTTDIPKFLEVDFITNTIFIIYEPISYKDIFPFFFSELKLGIIKLYNWKYYY